MVATALVVQILFVEAVLLAGVLMTIFGYAVWTRLSGSRRSARLREARRLIARHLETREIPVAGMDALRKLSSRDLTRLMFEVAPSMGDAERAWLRHLAGELGLLARKVSQSRTGEWWERLAASRLLTLLNADPDVMHPLLVDDSGFVRAGAAAYVVQRPTPEGIAALIAMLSDHDALCRFSARDSLMRLGPAAAPAIIERLADAGDPQILPLLEIACATASHRYMDAAVAHRGDSRPEVRLLVARLLRGIGGAGAAELLTTMVVDDSPLVREVAAEAIGYLTHWKASPAIAALLEDPVSRVRLAAALSLDRLGPAGELLLRRARARGSQRAAAAAARVLEDSSRGLPGPVPAT